MALVTGVVFPLLPMVPSKGIIDLLPALHSLNECGLPENDVNVGESRARDWIR